MRGKEKIWTLGGLSNESRNIYYPGYTLKNLISVQGKTIHGYLILQTKKAVLYGEYKIWRNFIKIKKFPKFYVPKIECL